MAASSNRQKDIFLQALELSSPDERAAFLAQACGSDAGLRRQVEALLQAHATPDSFLEKPAAAMGPTIDDLPCRPAERGGNEGPGTRVGPYKLLQQLGEGGMGVVYMAEQQEPVRRKVALKIIKPGMDSGQVIARFEAERQALAMMDHQNIARVLDAGTTASGRPYFVMELVHGVPITKFCDDRQLPPRQRLELFIPVCQAIQHAHQKGIIHRDIKPSNVLVTMYDDKPVPKVIDFGVAKAVEQRLTDKTLFTQYGTLVGTFEYMSPEQAEMNAFGVDTRSDIYSLGVLLYELLTGTTPLEKTRVREAALNEVVRLIKEEEPPRPSVRLSSSGTLAKIAAARQTEPAQLAMLVRGELDWIVMKSLEKDRSRRYETANGMAQDVQRYLTDEPVQAGPPSAGYRLRKFVKRNRGVVTAAAVVLTTLLAGIVGTSWGWVEALWQRDDAVQARKEEADQRKIAVKAISEKADADEQGRKFAEQVATTEKGKVQSVKAHLAFEKGNNRLDRGEMGAGLLWLARALEDLPRDETELEQSLRRILGGWSQRLHVPQRVFAHGSPILVVAFRPHSTAILTTGKDGIAWLWDSTTGKIIGKGFRHTKAIHRAAFSPDGKLLATAGEDHVVRLWDVDTGEPHGEALDVYFAHSLAFSGDGRLLFTGSGKGQNRFWDTATGKQHARLDTPESVLGAAFTPDGKTLLTAGIKGVRRWNVAGGKAVGEPLLQGYCDSITLRPDGMTFAAPLSIIKETKPGTVVVASAHIACYDTATGKPTGERIRLSGEDREFPTLPLSQDGRMLVTGRYGPVAVLHDAVTGKPIGQPMPTVGWSALRADGKAVLTTAEGGVALLWETASSTPRQFGNGQILAAAFSPDGKTLLTSNHLGMYRWDLASGRLVEQTDFVAFALAFSPDNKWYAAQGGRKNEKQNHANYFLWDAVTGKPVGTPTPLRPGSSHANFLRFSQDGKEIFTVENVDYSNSLVCRWEVASGKLVKVQPIEAFGQFVRVSPRGTFLLGFGTGGGSRHRPDVTVHEAASGKVVGKLMPHHGGVTGAAFSPDETQFATRAAGQLEGRTGGNVRLWSTASGLPLCEPVHLAGGDEAALFGKTIAFAPDGKTLAAAGSFLVQLWDVASMRRTGPPFDMKGEFLSIEFDPTGKTLAAFSLFEGGAQLFQTPQPLRGNPERIRLRIEVATYRELDASGAIVDLDAKTWRERFDRLQKLGGPPTP